MAKKHIKKIRKPASNVGKKHPKPPRKTRKPSAKAVKKVKAPSQKPVTKSSKASEFKSPYPRASTNVFREGSSYGIAYDILAAHPEGMPRQQLIERLAKVTKKTVKNAGYDAAVVLSAHPNSRHQSCRSGFIVVRENDNVRLEVTASAAAGK
jgi:hypothetical protein